MPYETQGPTPILPALAGLASAYYNIRDQMSRAKLDQQQQQIDKAIAQQQYGLGPDLQQLPTNIATPDTAGPAAASAAAQNQLGSFGQGKNGGIGAYQPPSAQQQQQAPQGPLAGLKPGSPEYFMAKASFYETQEEQAQNAFQRNVYHGLAEENRLNAQTAALNTDRESMAPLHQAQTGYYGARTKLTDAQITDLSHKFEHQMELLQMRGVQAEKIAQIRAAYRRAGGGRSGSGANLQYREYEAMDAAINRAQQLGVDMNNQAAMRMFDYKQELYAGNPDQYPQYAPGQLQPPQLQGMTIVMPNPTNPSTQIIFKMSPTGQIEQQSQQRGTPGSAHSAPASSGGGAYPPGTTATIKGKPVIMGHDGKWHPEGGGFGKP